MDKQHEYMVYEFGPFRADEVKRQLFIDGKPLPLMPKAFDTLLTLVRHRGTIVSKTDLINSIWAETAVEENNLTQQISALRKALGESPGDHRFIVTVPGRGYSFIAPVRDVHDNEQTDVVIQEITTSNVTIDLFADMKRDTAKTPFRLKTVAVLIGLLLTVIAAVSWFNFGHAGWDGAPRTMAVLPFESLDGSEDYLGVGIRDTLTAKLGNLQELNVRPTNLTTNYPDHDPIAAGRELKVDAVLDGTVQHDGEQIRVTVRITDVVGERVIWGKSFDKSTSDGFAMQDSISAEVVQVLQTRFHRHPIENVESNQIY
jgi:DNA-binding winged-HTH domains